MGQKILVVEDNELNLKLFCDLLGAHGYEAEPVRDGRQAVERARSFRPDLVVMDIQMPWISGLELIEQMKGDEELRATPIMAVTAYAAKGDEERIREAGAEGYVSKPISLMRFIEAVRGLLAGAEGPEEPGDGQRPAGHSRESENPSGASAVPEEEEEPDPPFRGDDGKEKSPDASDMETTSEAPPNEGNSSAAEEGEVDPSLRGDDSEPRGDAP